jgi:hypothetical protein
MRGKMETRNCSFMTFPKRKLANITANTACKNGKLRPYLSEIYRTLAAINTVGIIEACKSNRTSGTIQIKLYKFAPPITRPP